MVRHELGLVVAGVVDIFECTHSGNYEVLF